MRKIRLDVNELRVDSFDAEADKATTRGTVQAHNTQVFTCPRTQCGEQCLSGPQSCFFTEAFTDGQVACFCNTTDDTPL